MQRRKNYLVKATYQFKYAALMVFSILFVVAIVGWNLYYEAGSIILEKTRTGDVVDLVTKYNQMLVRSLPMILLAVIIVSLFISHEVAGPLMHLENGMIRIAEGDMTQKVMLRKGDEFKEIAVRFNSMLDDLKGKMVSDREHLQRIIFKLEDMKNKIGQGVAKKEEIDVLVTELREIGKQFKL
ncbi:MAG: HAMP domain-containing protein [bacterium]|nr:HAMP domain-containing protein [bacterium]MDD5757261.1 HAMP domain-containing protein [bacterium]